MLSIEEIKDILNKSKWKKPESIKKWVSNYYGMSIHIDGILPSFSSADGRRVAPDSRICPEYQYIFDHFLFSRHPREKDEQRWWRYSQYRPVQKDPFLRVINVVNAAIFQDTGYSITVENKEDEDFLWGIGKDSKQSLFSQFTANVKNIFTDAEGFLTVIPNKSWEEKGSAKVVPEMKFILTKNIKYYSSDEIVFDDDGIVWLINKVGYYRFKKTDKGEYVLMDANGYYAHLLGVLPIVKAGGYYSNNEYESWLIGAKPFADDYVSCKSGQQLVDKEASHPFIIAAASDCPDCHGVGYITYCSSCDHLVDKCSCDVEVGTFIKPKLLSCESCGGGGKQSRNPGDWMVVPKEDMEGDLLKIVSPNVDVNKHLKTTAESLYSSILSALHLESTDNIQSGIAKTKDLETRYQFIMAISNDWFDRVIPALINFTLALRNARAIDGVASPYVPSYTIIKPTQFNIKTASDLLIEYQISSQSGMPQYIRNRQLEDYVDKHFGGDKVMAKTVRVINELDIFASDTLQEQSSAIGTEEWYYHKQLPSAIKKVIRQRGELWFINADITDISAEIDKFVVVKSTPNMATNASAQGSPINGYYGEGNHATRTGASPTGTGSYNQDI